MGFPCHRLYFPSWLKSDPQEVKSFISYLLFCCCFFFKIPIVPEIPQILLTIPCTLVLYILWYTGGVHIPVLSIAFSVLLLWYWILMWYLAIPLFIVCVYVHPRWFYLVDASAAIFIVTSCVSRWGYMFRYRQKKTNTGLPRDDDAQ